MNLQPQIYVRVRSSPYFPVWGCAGCLVAVFALGGILGLLIFGWKTLLGL